MPVLSETLQAWTFVATDSAQSKQRTYRAVWTTSRETSSSLLQQGYDPKLCLLLHAEEEIHVSSSVSDPEKNSAKLTLTSATHA